MAYRYELYNSDSGLALRSGSDVLHERELYPNVPIQVISAAGYMVRGKKARGNEIVTLLQDIKNEAGAVVGKAGDRWLHVIAVDDNGAIWTVDSFTAIVHMGIAQGIFTDHEIPPPPEPNPIFPFAVSVRVDLPDDKSVLVGVQNEETRKALIFHTDYEFDELLINGDTYVKSNQG